MKILVLNLAVAASLIGCRESKPLPLKDLTRQPKCCQQPPHWLTPSVVNPTK